MYELEGVDFSKVGNFIAEGAHGVAYRYGKDKVIKFSDCGYLEEIKELIRKARRYKALPIVYSFGGCDDLYWVIMEYLPRKVTASHDHEIILLVRNKPNELTGEWRNLARSLERLGSRHGYWHMDICHDNVRLDKHGTPKVIDLESFLW